MFEWQPIAKIRITAVVEPRASVLICSKPWVGVSYEISTAKQVYDHFVEDILTLGESRVIAFARMPTIAKYEETAFCNSNAENELTEGELRCYVRGLLQETTNLSFEAAKRRVAFRAEKAAECLKKLANVKEEE